MTRLVALAAVLRLALAGAASAPWPVFQDLVEEIREFSARVEVQPDGSVEVTGEILVHSLGIQVRRGIYRDILLRFRDDPGLFPPEFRLIEALRDGAPEDARLARANGGVRA